MALIAWLVTAKKQCGDLGVACTGSNNPMLAGNVAALLSPLVFIPVLTLVFGLVSEFGNMPRNASDAFADSFPRVQDKYDWQSMMSIRRGDDHEMADEAHVDLEGIPGEHVETEAEMEEEQKQLLRAGKISKTLTVVMVSPHAPTELTRPLFPSLTTPGGQTGAGLPGPLADAHVRLRLHL